ncbi:unnamed protein product [Rotaria sp. Silwood2]|nr:unnamed protein product [Rotaria sp. Silwood2]CAF4334421.1 unnamed protein product [Rotaria sp. Silwood2]
MNLQFNTKNINYRPGHMSEPRPPLLSTTSYIHLHPNVNQKSNLYDAAQRKYSHPDRKFQTSSTTTFSDYTNISEYKRINNLQKTLPGNNVIDFKPNKNTIYVQISSLVSLDCFQQPSRKNRRKLQHAEQYKNQAQLFETNYENVNDKFLPTSNEFNGLILWDSMLKFVSPDKVSPHGIKVNVSFQSGCECSRMLNSLEKQHLEQNHILQVDFVVFSLCTNDVANLGLNLTIQRYRYLIQHVRQLFP